MITIVNIGPQSADKGGWRNYEVRINQEVICKFRHKRSHGLAECLRSAAGAVELDKARKLGIEP